MEDVPTAVCIAGQIRTFLQHEVQHAFVTHFHRTGYEYIVSTNTKRPAAANSLLLAPIVAWVQSPAGSSGALGPAEVYRGTDLDICPVGTCKAVSRGLLSVAHRLAACYDPLLREEARRRFHYAYIFRVRPDHLFLTRILHPAEFLRGLPSGRILLFDDQIAVARRAMATTVLLIPQLVYATCKDAKDWQRACRHTAVEPGWSISRCRDEQLMPCETMWLVSAFGPSESSASQLPLSHRAWNTSSNAPIVPGDVCIKRITFLQDDATNDCRQNAGCMDC